MSLLDWLCGKKNMDTGKEKKNRPVSNDDDLEEEELMMYEEEEGEK